MWRVGIARCIDNGGWVAVARCRDNGGWVGIARSRKRGWIVIGGSVRAIA